MGQATDVAAILRRHTIVHALHAREQRAAQQRDLPHRYQPHGRAEDLRVASPRWRSDALLPPLLALMERRCRFTWRQKQGEELSAALVKQKAAEVEAEEASALGATPRWNDGAHLS